MEGLLSTGPTPFSLLKCVLTETVSWLKVLFTETVSLAYNFINRDSLFC